MSAQFRHMIGRRITAVTPGGFAPTKRNQRPAGYWTKPEEVVQAANRAMFRRVRTIRVK